MAHIQLLADGRYLAECESVILVPEKGLTEAGYIQMLTEETDSSSKHKFHAMAQMAYYQYQDDELEVVALPNSVEVLAKAKNETMISGLILCRMPEGELKAYAIGELNIKKLLEAAHRFCTRWVRLDI